MVSLFLQPPLLANSLFPITFPLLVAKERTTVFILCRLSRRIIDLTVSLSLFLPLSLFQDPNLVCTQRSVLIITWGTRQPLWRLHLGPNLGKELV